MFTDENRRELEEDGVTVVQGVVSLEDCDRHQAHFRQWLDTFPEGAFPQSKNSLIQRYRTGHMQPAWEARLAAKPVFAQVWGTEKLLSSMDAIAIGRPPEEGDEMFWAKNQSWLHVDQSADRKGLHAYQGAVYLEECEEDDWTFEVIKGSHLLFDDFMTRTQQWKCFNLKPHHIEWFDKKDCQRIRVPCPKGGMILWDSRLFHANARPYEGRTNAGRWRYCVFVCMAPASWAEPTDIAKKVDAYEKMLLTTHWPSQGVQTFSTRIFRNQVRDVEPVAEMPEVAKSEEAQRLVGILPYPEDDEEAVTDAGASKAAAAHRPVWDKETWASAMEEFKSKNPYGGRKGVNDSRKHPHKTQAMQGGLDGGSRKRSRQCTDRASSSSSSTKVPSKHRCDSCDRLCASGAGLRSHMRRHR